jgi:cytochrome c5
MAEHDEHSSFIKTPQQLITIVVLAFVVPIFGIIMMVQLVVNKPHADPAALTPEAIAARLQPVGKVEFGAAAPAGGAPREGEEIVKAICGACHLTGAAGAPKIGDKAAWGARLKEGLNGLLATAIKGKNAMPARGGAADLTDFELARAIVYMANQSGGSLKEPAQAKPAATAKAK